MWTRRDVLRLGLATGSLLLSASPRATRAELSQPPRARKPRYTVILFLSGGIDPIWTFDPKQRSEIEPDVDLAYGPDQIVTSGGVRLGPHFATLAKYAGRMAIVNGVHLNTANHHTGHMQIIRLRTSVHGQMPSLLDILGSRREGQPLSSITLGTSLAQGYSSGTFGTPIRMSSDPKEKDLFGSIDELAPADLERMARVLRSQAAGLRSAGASAEALRTAANIEQAAALFAQLPKVKPFTMESWAEDRAAQQSTENLQRVLWALENDLTSSAFVEVGGQGWDTHQNNDAAQTRLNKRFATFFAKFLDKLDTLRNAHGTLADNTLIVAGSEIGRFPRLNSVKGKDHLPQAPYLFIGPSINTGGGQGAVYGRTGRQMEGLPVSLQTGRDVSTGGQLMTLDDLGTTLLHAAGFQPSIYGYTGRNLEFLLGA
jgi:uncharacterized protein (DUF1501 family)